MDSHKQTRFALRAAHRVVPCKDCHPSTERADDDKRTIAQLIGIDSRCTGCHGTPHGGQFDRRKPAFECWECHRETRFHDLTFDHQQSRFPLQGAHQKVACSSCHVRARPAKPDDKPAPVRFTGTARDCAGCHVDPHRGQFAANGPKKVCSDCHVVRKGRHAEIAKSCETCHTTARFADQSRYRVSCHRQDAAKAYPNHKALGFGDGCAGCHQEFGWRFLRPGFHEKWFALRSGPHRRFDGSGQCTSCHTDGIGGGKFTCVGCHDGAHAEKRTKALHKNIGGFQYKDSACKSCHPTGKL